MRAETSSGKHLVKWCFLTIAVMGGFVMRNADCLISMRRVRKSRDIQIIFVSNCETHLPVKANEFCGCG
jgi:hypothetical protein